MTDSVYKVKTTGRTYTGKVSPDMYGRPHPNHAHGTGNIDHYWLYRVKFGIPATNLTTKGDSITFSTPTIEGAVSRRNKVDAFGKHPWKAEFTDDGSTEAKEAVTTWFTQVYEPVAAGNNAGGNS